jgi:hypothetical protein
LLAGSLEAPAALVVGRIAGAALLSAGAACWRRAMTGRAAPGAGWSPRCCCITALPPRFSRTLHQA